MINGSFFLTLPSFPIAASCTHLLGTTKQLSTSVYAALIEPGFGGGIANEDEFESDSQENVPLVAASPFDPRSKPLSPFESARFVHLLFLP